VYAFPGSPQSPFGRPQAAKLPDIRQTLWTFRRDGVEWSGELVFRVECYGWEARVRRNQSFGVALHTLDAVVFLRGSRAIVANPRPSLSSID